MAHLNMYAQIMVANFQEFDKGGVVQTIIDHVGLTKGDTFHWECAQFEGLAKIVSPGEFVTGGRWYEVQKVG